MKAKPDKFGKVSIQRQELAYLRSMARVAERAMAVLTDGKISPETIKRYMDATSAIQWMEKESHGLMDQS